MKVIRLEGSTIEAAAKEAAQVLRKGGIVLYPTDTLYGLAVDAENRAALKKLRELKGREKKKPMSIVVSDVASIEHHAEFPPHARSLAEKFLPGALTLVLPGKSHLPPEIMLNNAIGLRVPDDSFSLALARTFGRPFTATSANRSGLPTLSAVHPILAQFGHLADDIDLVIDGGIRESGKPSTVVTYQEGNLRVLREGVVDKSTLGLK
jgi:L-threonylcarbamoyladenylate synthase